MFRTTLFWLHLSAGLTAGVTIAIMCFTGTTLAFEKQLLARTDRDVRVVTAPLSADAPRLTLDELTRRVRAAFPNARPTAIAVTADPHAAVIFQLGRDAIVYANPFTGDLRPPSAVSTQLRAFLRTMEDWHRWLARSGDQRPLGKTVNGIGNAAFLVLALTGLYLWFPRSWSWRSVRAVAVINFRAAGKARDFNWHHSLGLWCAPVLIVLTLTALPMSFRWANDLIYRFAGETPPSQTLSTQPAAALPAPAANASPLSRDAQFAAVQRAFPAWQQLTLRLNPAAAPMPAPAAATFLVKLPHPWPRTATTTVTLNPFTGEILRREAFSDLTPGRRARLWSRFLHTGEALGPLGQLVAALATLGGCFLVFTGFALAWRRFFFRPAA